MIIDRGGCCVWYGTRREWGSVHVAVIICGTLGFAYVVPLWRSCGPSNPLVSVRGVGVLSRVACPRYSMLLRGVDVIAVRDVTRSSLLACLLYKDIVSLVWNCRHPAHLEQASSRFSTPGSRSERPATLATNAFGVQLFLPTPWPSKPLVDDRVEYHV